MMTGMQKVDADRCVMLSEEKMEQSLPCFYRAVAEAAGYTETEDTMYDCTKIFVAPNVQNAIIRYYETKFPEVSREQIITLLLISGPKVNANLKENEVVIQKGFVSEK